MPGREDIPERLRVHLVRELDSVPLAAPEPVDARYRMPVAPAASGRVRRLATAGVIAAAAAAVLGAGAFAAGAPPQVVHWFDQLPFAAPTAPPSAEPSETPEPTPPPAPAVEPSEAPSSGEAQEHGSPQPSGSDRELGSPTPTRTPDSEHDGDRTSTTGGHD